MIDICRYNDPCQLGSVDSDVSEVFINSFQCEKYASSSLSTYLSIVSFNFHLTLSR